MYYFAVSWIHWHRKLNCALTGRNSLSTGSFLLLSGSPCFPRLRCMCVCPLSGSGHFILQGKMKQKRIEMLLMSCDFRGNR